MYGRPYRLSHTEYSIDRSKENGLLHADIIKETDSNYAFYRFLLLPVILVKKNGYSGLCVECTRITFGLTNAPFFFMPLYFNKIVDSCTRGKETNMSTPVLGDLLMPLFDVESGLELLRTALDKLTHSGPKFHLMVFDTMS